MSRIGDTLTDMYTQANIVHDALVAAGMPEPAASYALYQAYHETGAFKSPEYTGLNNASGIKYAGQANATKDTGKGGYAHFKSLADWANAMKHEATKGSNPASAATLEDYSHRLKMNGYYGDSEDNYTHGLTRARLVLKALPAEARAVQQPDGSAINPADLDIPGSKTAAQLDKQQGLEKQLMEEGNTLIAAAKAHPIAAAGIGVGILLILGKIFGSEK